MLSDGPGVPVPPGTVGSGAGGGSVIAPPDGAAEAVADPLAGALPCGATPPVLVADAVGVTVGVPVLVGAADVDVDADAEAEAEADADPLGPGAAVSFSWVLARTRIVTNPMVTMAASAIRMTSTDVAPREESTRTVDPFPARRSKIIEP